MQDFFGKQADISELTNGDGERFLKWLKRKKKKNGEPYGPNYIHKIIKTSRQVFAYAASDDLLDVNIMEGVKAPEVITDERDFDVTLEMTETILKTAITRGRNESKPHLVKQKLKGKRQPKSTTAMCHRFSGGIIGAVTPDTHQRATHSSSG
ncbi:MAG: hypothetical protein ABGZ53_31450 [Fuerstiella sp.]